MYWGKGRLSSELGSLIDDFNANRIDGAAYRLQIGSEVYISPTGEPGDDRTKVTLRLAPGEEFVIPPGQFGFILTQETIKVPSTALAFISMRATYKFRGLVNVSGFHVDPDYEGKLIFAVFNAGPSFIHLKQGEECFLIWYADLDTPAPGGEEFKRGYESLPSKFTSSIGSGIQSFDTLLTKINDIDKRQSDRLTSLEREQAVIKWAAALAVGALMTLSLRECSISQAQLANTQISPSAEISGPAAPSSTVLAPVTPDGK